jgi:hypothetical protein
MMKQTAPRILEKSKGRITKTADSILSVAILVLISKASAQASLDTKPSAVEYFIVCILLALSCLLQAGQDYPADRKSFVKNVCFGALFVLSGAAWLFLWESPWGVLVLAQACLLAILTNRILAATAAKKASVRVLNIILSAATLIAMIATLALTLSGSILPVAIHGILVAGRALIHIIYISFAQMRLGVLRKVIRKTFAAEILMGLLLLIVAFSFVFQTVEPGIKTYFDAVWYCFAVVTTIGFGDIAVTSVLSRTLSIILGVFGIVVVAVITSVVVSFYNEVRNDRKDEKIEPGEEQNE